MHNRVQMSSLVIESYISPGLPPQSICAHCSIPLSKDLHVKPYVLRDGSTLNVIQGLQFVFQRRQPEKQQGQSSLIKFCASCDSSFKALLHLFINFIRTAAKDSLVRKLAPTLKGIPKSSSDLNVLQNLEEVKVEYNSDPDSENAWTPMTILPDLNQVDESLSENTFCQNVSLERLSMRITRKRKQSHTYVLEEGDYTDVQDDERSVTPIPELEVTNRPGLRCRKPQKVKTDKQGWSSGFYPCITCNEMFSSQVKLRRHSSDHTGSRPFKCNQCEANFATQSALTRHTQTKHKRKFYTPVQEDERSVTPVPELEVTNQRRLRCRKPQKPKTDKQGRSSGIYSCIICNEKFSSQIKLRRHESDHTGSRPFKCNQCEGNYPTQRLLTHHTRRTHPHPTQTKYRREPYRPKVKPRPSPRVEARDSALLKTDEYKCAEMNCAEQKISFPSLKEWILHHEEVHGEVMRYGNVKVASEVIAYDGLYRPCPHCGKKYKTKAPLIAHIKVVHLKRHEFQCGECNRVLISKFALTQHMQLIHGTNERSFLCSLCGATFLTKGTLVAHEKIHLDVTLEPKQFTCSICAKKYERRYRLNRHMETAHTDARNFVCNICGHDFKILHQLNHHKRVSHKKNADQVCSYCGKSYRRKQYLKAHLIEVHKLDHEQARVEAKIKQPQLFRVLPNGDRVFKENPNVKPNTTCPICNRTYVRRKQLYLHLISAHNHTEEESRNLTKFESKPEWSSLQKHKRRKPDDEEDDEESDFSLMQL